MKTIVIGNQKGGVGKSVIAINIAYYFKEIGYNVIFIDLDPQGDSGKIIEKDFQNFHAADLFRTKISFSNTLDDLFFKATPELSNYLVGVDLQTFKDNFKFLAEYSKSKKTICIVDTGPTASDLQIAPFTIADYILCPIELDEYSIEAIATVTNTINNTKKIHNPKLTFLGIIPNRVHGTSPSQKAMLKTLQTSYSHLLLDEKLLLTESEVVRTAKTNRMPVWKVKTRAKSKKEFFDFVQVVASKIS